MNRFAIKFNKRGYIKYTSHLDMLRLFKRAMKRCDIRLKYSQGYNPHPKMSFAQPLSLGYESMGEILEIETAVAMEASDIKARLAAIMPEGIEITDVTSLPEQSKTLAAACIEAEYLIAVPVDESFRGRESELAAGYLGQQSILAKKRQKKSKELKEIDIKGMIKSLNIIFINNNYIMTLIADSGSSSNLSPELVIASFLEFAGIDCDRSEIEVMRKKLFFKGYDI